MKDITYSGSTKTNQTQGIKQFALEIQKPNIQNRFLRLLGKDPMPYLMGFYQQMLATPMLANADVGSILIALGNAAALGLPVDKSGQCWILPYKAGDKVFAQFQVGTRGYTELALRTGLYEKITHGKIGKSQYKGFNPLTEELDADWGDTSDMEIVAYFAHLSTKNGFKKTIVMTTEQLRKHAEEFSTSYKFDKDKKSLWNKNFEAMATKTVIKKLLRNWGEFPSDSIRAIAINNDQKISGSYLDNGESNIKGVEEELDNIIEIVEPSEVENEPRGL